MSHVDLITFARLAPGRFRLTGLPPRSGIVQIEVTFKLPPGYLRPFFCFAQRPGPGTRYTFPNFEFNPAPPGQRIGPWPGWREIPQLPTIQLEGDGQTAPGRFFFLGDEEPTRRLRACFVLAKASGGNITLTVDDPRLNPLTGRLFPGGIGPAPAHPVQLRPDLVGRHPRLLFDHQALRSIRERRRSTHRPHFERLVKLLAAGNLPFEVSAESKALAGSERLSPEDLVLVRALLALADPSDRSVKAARNALLRYLRTASRKGYPPMGVDTQSGESLFIGCLAYDWLHSCLSSRERTSGQQALRKMAAICRDHLGPDRRDYAQAHYLGCGLGLLAYSFLMWEDDPDARLWAAELRGAFGLVLKMLPPDGAYPHGINLWVYEYGFILRWLELFRQCTGEDLWKTSPNFSRTSRFRAATTSPDGLHAITFGDPQYQIAGDSWCHFLIAARTGSQNAQEFGNRLIDCEHAGIDHRHIPPRRRVYEYLWHDPGRSAAKLRDGLHIFEDTGQIFIRRADKFLTVRCGPPLGAHRRARGEWGGYGHTDPCQGAFLLWYGDQFVASGPGPVYRRETGMHNTITVDGRGQAGDRCAWAPDFLAQNYVPDSPEVISEKNEITVRMDLTPSYLRHLGVVRHVRTLRIDAGMNIVGRDEIKLRRTRLVRWHLHSWCPVKVLEKGDAPEFELGSICHLVFRRSIGSRLTRRTESFVPAYPNDGRRGTAVSIRRRTDQTIFNWRLTWNQTAR